MFNASAAYKTRLPLFFSLMVDYDEKENRMCACPTVIDPAPLRNTLCDSSSYRLVVGSPCRLFFLFLPYPKRRGAKKKHSSFICSCRDVVYAEREGNVSEMKKKRGDPAFEAAVVVVVAARGRIIRAVVTIAACAQIVCARVKKCEKEMKKRILFFVGATHLFQIVLSSPLATRDWTEK